MDFDTRDRAEFLLKTIEMIVGDAQRNSDPEGSYVDFPNAYQAIAELRTLIEAG